MKLNEIHIRDPYILALNDKYYMYGTRGKGCWDVCSGFDVYVSDNLVEWSDPVSVFEKNDNFWGTRQFWAPEVHEYNGKFYMFASFKDENRHRATHILVSDAPDKTFVPLTSEPITPSEWDCLDGTLYVSKAGEPYLVFCHEWTQVSDGEICAVPLTNDLKERAGEVKILFKGSHPAWATGTAKGNFVTDGPFLYRDNNDLYVIWSTYVGNYVEAFAVSTSGEITGEWLHSEKFIFHNDGGHGMIFKDFNGNLKFIMHKPNVNPDERPVIFDIEIENKTIFLKK